MASAQRIWQALHSMLQTDNVKTQSGFSQISRWHSGAIPTAIHGCPNCLGNWAPGPRKQLCCNATETDNELPGSAAGGLKLQVLQDPGGAQHIDSSKSDDQFQPKVLPLWGHGIAQQKTQTLEQNCCRPGQLCLPAGIYIISSDMTEEKRDGHIPTKFGVLWTEPLNPQSRLENQLVKSDVLMVAGCYSANESMILRLLVACSEITGMEIRKK